MRFAIRPRARPSTRHRRCRRCGAADVDAAERDERGEREVGGTGVRAVGEHRGGHERGGGVAGRERARDRAAHAVGERLLVLEVLEGAEPAEQRLHRAVREPGLDRHRGGEAPHHLGSWRRDGARAGERTPDQPVVGCARQAVEEAVERRVAERLDPLLDRLRRACGPGRRALERRRSGIRRRLLSGSTGVLTPATVGGVPSTSRTTSGRRVASNGNRCEPVAAGVEVEVGDQHRGFVVRRLHENPSVRIADERRAVERQRALHARPG